MSAHSEWWETFFEGIAVDLWLRAIPPDQTQRETEMLVRLLDVPAGAELLDVPCGGGRLALALADRGYRVTGVDLSQPFLNYARSTGRAEAVAWEQRDMRDLPWSDRFDGAFCVGNSFGYLDDDANAAFLRAVAAALKPGARFVLETPMVLENLLAHIRDRAWWPVGEMYLLAANAYDHTRGRLEIDYTFMAGARVEVRHGSHRAYTYRELVDLLAAAGFAVTVDPPWTRDAHTVTFVATRRPA